jgi:transcription-repair coupling factor (superfamily II helicase)
MLTKELIERELGRKGQVFYLHNNVTSLGHCARRIKSLIPDVSVGIIHGQMDKKEIEDVMLGFCNNEIQVLVCTSIIENGIDIPNANLIIVEDSENYGLSQLYQIKGRVGRGNRIAYAYITYRKNKVLSEIATKRLNAIREFTEFGSGFKIAMRDLEIRGAGNLIGAEQHGHMDAVGYETYCKILEGMIKELKGEEVYEEIDEVTTIDLNINAYISEKYIKSEIQKMEMYQRISKAITNEEVMDIIDELTDRFGDVPRETLRLLKVVEIKYLAAKLEITNISEKNGNIVLEFMVNAKIDLEKIVKIINENRRKVMFSAGTKAYLTIIKEKKEKDNLKNIKFVLQSLLG